MSLRKQLGLDKKRSQAKPKSKPPEPPKPPDPPPPPVVEVVPEPPPPEKVFQCGHTIKEAGITRYQCPGCHRRVLREQKKKKRDAQQKKWKDEFNERMQRDRLPDMTSFHLVYDAENRLWRGALRFFDPPADDISPPRLTETFEGSGTGLFKLLSDLDLQYRKWLQREAIPQPEPETPDEIH